TVTASVSAAPYPLGSPPASTSHPSKDHHTIQPMTPKPCSRPLQAHVPTLPPLPQSFRVFPVTIFSSFVRNTSAYSSKSISPNISRQHFLELSGKSRGSQP